MKRTGAYLCTSPNCARAIHGTPFKPAMHGPPIKMDPPRDVDGRILPQWREPRVTPFDGEAA